MGELLRALIVDETRASLVDVLSALDESCGYEARFAVASNETELRQELAAGAWDVILAQRVAPTLGALRILELVRTRTPRIPVVVYSEKHTEAELVAVMRAGAADCLDRSSLDRLCATVERELKAARGAERGQPREASVAGAADRYRLLVEEIPALTYVAWADAIGSTAYVSPQLRAMTGFEPAEWIAEPRTWAQRLHPDDRERVLREFRASCASGAPFVSEYRILDREERVVWWHNEGRVLCDSAGRPQFVRGFIRDITEQKRAEETIRRMRLYDALTGLPNRVLFAQRLQETLAAGATEASPLALLVLALDRFREINNTLGQHHGDRILQALAARLGEALGDPERVARLRGDEFGCLVPGADASLARQLAGRILKRLEEPFMVERLPIEVGASLGVAVAPEHGQEAEELLRRADMAVQTAKRQGGGLVVYSTECDPYDPDRLALLSELRNALDSTQQLSLHYQPKVTLTDRRVVGAEALLRWHHPKRGAIPPNRFIPVAEQAGLIRPLTRWVLDAALQQGRRWHASGRRLPIAVNLSARSLHDPGLVDEIAGALEANGVAPELLLLEITESAVMVDPGRAAETLDRLHARGVGVSIDDFGTGYSSLGYLRSLPVSELKIDRSFVSGLRGNDGADRAIVRSTSELGHNLGLRVVAEGVEDEGTFELLASMGCDLAQGYWIGRPMATGDLDAWLDRAEWPLASA